jgi:hypothetical protein
MTPPSSPDRDLEQACLLLKEYSFDLGGYQPSDLMHLWQKILEAEPSWIRAAVVEAIYQGRYRGYSVEQILRVWKRRGHPLRHFNQDFERVVFGPIDPTVSKYARLTTQRPSEFLLVADSASGTVLPTPEAPSGENSAAAAPEAAPAQMPTAHPEAEPPDTATENIRPPSGRRTDAPIPMPQEELFSHSAPIQKFVPDPQPSDFYYRLQSVARYPAAGDSGYWNLRR